MFYGWEDFRRGSKSSEQLLDLSVPLVGDTMDIISDLQKQIKVMMADALSKDDKITNLQRDLESVIAQLQAQQTLHSETIAHKIELEKELQQRIMLEQGLVKQLEDQDIKHDKIMAEVKDRCSSEIERLSSLVRVLSDAEERLCLQLGDLEAEAIEQSQKFNAETSSLSLSLAQKEHELTSSQAELESMRQSKISLKELETRDLSAELSKSTLECGRMKLRMDALDKEIEDLRLEAENMEQELAMAKLISSWQQNENRTRQEENIRLVRPRLCKSESLSFAKQPRARFGELQCGAV